MQTPVTNMLAGLFGLAGSGPSTGIFAEGGEGGDLFSQLLTGFDTSTGQGQQNLPGGAAGELLPGVQASLLTAQQINVNTANEDPTALLSQEVSPADATQLLADLDAGKFGDPSGNELLQQLHEQLSALAQSTEPKTVGEIVQAIATPKADAIKAVQPGMAQRALAWFHAALKKPDENEALANKAQPAAPLLADANLQSLQASHFRPRGDAAAGKDGEAQTDDEKSKIKVEIVPMSQTILVPQWVASIAPEKPAVADNNTDSLPEIELPKIGGKESSLADKLASAREDFSAQKLAMQQDANTQQLVGAANLADRAAFKEHLAADAYHVADNSADPVVTPATSAGAVHTQTIHAPQAVSTVALPPGVVNHAPIAEQVHVAISRASKDNIDHITLQLEPAHLGRVEVQMRMGHDGQTQISFIADKPETFDALSRDARALEASLQEAGIKADAGSMQFNLRQQPQPQQMDANFGQGQGDKSAQNGEIEEVKPADVHASLTPIGSYNVNVQDGVDIHA